MNIRDLTNLIKKKFLKRILYRLNGLSDKNLIRAIKFTKKMYPGLKGYLDSEENAIKINHPSIQLVRKIIAETDKHCLDKLVENFFIQGLVINSAKAIKEKKKGGTIPTTILISPTMRCNLRCIGCYAARYTKEDDLSFNTFDRIIKEAKELGGVGFFTILGGEPLIFNRIWDIFKKHNDIYFQFYTNGTLINESTVKKLIEVGNAMPMISIEGFKKRTDERRGKGVYEKIMKAMDLLHKNGIPFGYSVAVTNKNAEEVMGDKFMDFIIKKGARVGWYFLYMPVGKSPDLKLMPTPIQRKNMMERGKIIRATKPVFIVDFWNDAPYVGGCIAAKEYIHITSKGDVEPCIFTHFAADNINNKSLKEVLNSDYFKAIRAGQPYNKNLYLPCMWIDNPEVSRGFFKKYGAYPTHDGAEEVLQDIKLKKGIDSYSKKVKQVFSKFEAESQTKSVSKPE